MKATLNARIQRSSIELLIEEVCRDDMLVSEQMNLFPYIKLTKGKANRKICLAIQSMLKARVALQAAKEELRAALEEEERTEEHDLASPPPVH